MNTTLSHTELLRYARHIRLPEIGVEGQERLRSARVLVVGAGGLGSPCLMYLAAAGIGTIGIADDDAVDLSNLQRQLIHGTSDVGVSKTASAAKRIREIDPGVRVVEIPERLTARNALGIARDYDIIADGTDNFAARFLINDVAVKLRKPNVYGSVQRFDGQASVFSLNDGPCYRCLFREPPPAGTIPSCAEAGVLGVLPGLIGTIQATEVLKLLLGSGDALAGRLLLVDALGMNFRTIRVRRDPECPACSDPDSLEIRDWEIVCGVTGDVDTQSGEISPAELHDLLARAEDIDMVDVREPFEWQLGHIPGARLVPLSRIAGDLGSFSRERLTVVYCATGARSAAAAQQLADAGFTRVASLSGGIARWRREIEHELAFA